MPFTNWFPPPLIRVQDDLVIMIEGELLFNVHPNFSQDGLPIGTDGRYYFQAGAICLPGKSPFHGSYSYLGLHIPHARN